MHDIRLLIAVHDVQLSSVSGSLKFSQSLYLSPFLRARVRACVRACVCVCVCVCVCARASCEHTHSLDNCKFENFHKDLNSAQFRENKTLAIWLYHSVVY